MLLIHGIRRPDPDMYCADLDMEFDQDMQEWNQEEIERYCKTFKKGHKKIVKKNGKEYEKLGDHFG